MSVPFYLPKEPGQTRKFLPMAGAAAVQPYAVPLGATFLEIIAAGAGAGGGGGFTRAAAAAGGGGGGGGSGAFARIILPVALIPQTLYVLPGLGGAGGAAGAAGAAGGIPLSPSFRRRRSPIPFFGPMAGRAAALARRRRSGRLARRA